MPTRKHNTKRKPSSRRRPQQKVIDYSGAVRALRKAGKELFVVVAQHVAIGTNMPTLQSLAEIAFDILPEGASPERGGELVRSLLHVMGELHGGIAEAEAEAADPPAITFVPPTKVVN